MIHFIISIVTLTIMICVAIASAVMLIIAVFGMINNKITCNNHYLKKELKDRNKIIANLLNSRNR